MESKVLKLHLTISISGCSLLARLVGRARNLINETILPHACEWLDQIWGTEGPHERGGAPRSLCVSLCLLGKDMPGLSCGLEGRLCGEMGANGRERPRCPTSDPCSLSSQASPSISLRPHCKWLSPSVTTAACPDIQFMGLTVTSGGDQLSPLLAS